LPSILLPTQSDRSQHHPYEQKHHHHHHHPHGKNDSYREESAANMNFMEYVNDNVDQKILGNYFNENVCRPEFFRSKILEWDDLDFPPPNDHQAVHEYQPILYHHSNPVGAANQYNRHHFFDHNLYLLCGGADDIMFFDGDDEDGVDRGFLMLGDCGCDGHVIHDLFRITTIRRQHVQSRTTTLSSSSKRRVYSHSYSRGGDGVIGSRRRSGSLVLVAASDTEISRLYFSKVVYYLMH
jgi:hypothetical protein